MILGILNVTPDSFWDGGRHADVMAAVARACVLLDEGAHVIDVGGESSRPGATAVHANDEIARVVPVIEALLRERPDTVISVDTTKAAVASAALDAGARMINDVSGFRLDPMLPTVVARAGARVILMHSRGGLEDMASYTHADYRDVATDVCDELSASVAVALAAGIAEDAIVLDPGLGFSKRTEHSIALLANLDRIASLGYPVLVGPSRKRFVGDVAGGLPVEQRLEGTIAACCIAYAAGARLFRVHDVAPVIRALAVSAAVSHARAAVDVTMHPVLS